MIEWMLIGELIEYLTISRGLRKKLTFRECPDDRLATLVQNLSCKDYQDRMPLKKAIATLQNIQGPF